MEAGFSLDFDPFTYQVSGSHSFPKTPPSVAPQKLQRHAILPPPRTHPEISQIWSADVRRASRRLDNELEVFDRLSLKETAPAEQPTRSSALSWPPLANNDNDAWLWLSETSKVSSPRTDQLLTQTSSNGSPLRVKDAPLWASPVSDEAPLSLASFPSWSLDSALQASSFSAYSDIGADFRGSPTPDSVDGSDSDSSGPSSCGRQASLSPIPAPQRREDRFAHTQTYEQQIEVCRDTERASFSSASFSPRQISPVPIGFQKPTDDAAVKPATQLLATSSPQSMLLNQLHVQHGFHVADSAGQTGAFIPVGFLYVPSHATTPGEWQAQRGWTGPSFRNRKSELYKTEMCRNWEEKGSCEYGL